MIGRFRLRPPLSPRRASARSPESIEFDVARNFSARAARSSAAQPYLRAAALSANRRSSDRSSSPGSKSQSRSARSKRLRDSSSATSAASSALTDGSINCGACCARRSRRRIAADRIGIGEAAPADGARRFGDFLTHLFRLHHGLAPRCEGRFLAGRGRKPVELLPPHGADSLPPCAPLRRRDRCVSSASRASAKARCASRVDVALLQMAAEMIEQRAMGGRIDQRPIVMLAMQFDEARADRAKRLGADRLIVDAGARAAIGELNAFENKIAVDGDVVGAGGDRAPDDRPPDRRLR